MKQRRREGKEVTAIDGFEIAHFCEKKNKMVNEEADAVLVCSTTMYFAYNFKGQLNFINYYNS